MWIGTASGTSSKTRTEKGTDSLLFLDRVILARVRLRRLPFEQKSPPVQTPAGAQSWRRSCYCGPGPPVWDGRVKHWTSSFYSHLLANDTPPKTGRVEADHCHLKCDVPTTQMVQRFGNRLGNDICLRMTIAWQFLPTSTRQTFASTTANRWARPSLFLFSPSHSALSLMPEAPFAHLFFYPERGRFFPPCCHPASLATLYNSSEHNESRLILVSAPLACRISPSSRSVSCAFLFLGCRYLSSRTL